MKKSRQHELAQWLKQQSVPAKRWLQLVNALGVAGGMLLIVQAWLLATLLQAFIIEQQPRSALTGWFIALLCTFLLRAILHGIRERVGFICGSVIRQQLRRRVLDRLQQLGPAYVQNKPAGSWATIIVEQIDNLQDYYARYLPQRFLAMMIPLLILLAIFPLNWAAALILLVTAPLIPLFMVLVGMGAADANRRNFTAMARLSGHFLDRLQGLETLRLFNRAQAETAHIEQSADNFRQRTMEVLRLAFLSSAVLEFFASVSIAVVAVYFGFTYLGEFHFGHYGLSLTLFSGFLVLILAPEFFQPLRDLGTFYHAKAQAIGAADVLEVFLATEALVVDNATLSVSTDNPFYDEDALTLEAHDVEILSSDGTRLAGPLNFVLSAHQRVALVGPSGAGKSSLLNVLLGFLPYRGSLRVNGLELRELTATAWQQNISWVGQHPHLPAQTLRQNILLRHPAATEEALQQVLQRAYINEFLSRFPQGLETPVGDNAARLSVGQAQRVAVARALLMPCRLLLLDEPTASLDAQSERWVMQALQQAALEQTTLLVTHQLEDTRDYDQIWVMESGVVVQQGDYATLSGMPGLFADLLAHRQREV